MTCLCGTTWRVARACCDQKPLERAVVALVAEAQQAERGLPGASSPTPGSVTAATGPSAAKRPRAHEPSADKGGVGDSMIGTVDAQQTTQHQAGAQVTAVPGVDQLSTDGDAQPSNRSRPAHAATEPAPLNVAPTMARPGTRKVAGSMLNASLYRRKEQAKAAAHNADSRRAPPQGAHGQPNEQFVPAV